LAAHTLVFALETNFSGSKPVWLVYRVMNYPMILLWDASGLLRDNALNWKTWVDVSMLLFSAIIGFGMGALTCRIFFHDDDDYA
jgi:uncharacterized membrane protein YedE/YeeE